jgi:hypothetical protein
MRQFPPLALVVVQGLSEYLQVAGKYGIGGGAPGSTVQHMKTVCVLTTVAFHAMESQYFSNCIPKGEGQVVGHDVVFMTSVSN